MACLPGYYCPGCRRHAPGRHDEVAWPDGFCSDECRRLNRGWFRRMIVTFITFFCGRMRHGA